MKRRPFLVPLLLPVLGLAVLAAAVAWFVDARATTIVIVIRHAETETSTDGDAALSVVGRERAAHLVRLLYEAKPVRGIDAVYVSELRRTQQTASPVAETSGLPVNVIPTDTWDSLPARIRRQHHGENVLVVGNSTTVPQLVEALAGEPVMLKDDEYDAMFIVFLPQLAHARVVKLHY
ncbi:MAG: phosphoglycerate mutase family protein [Steroidobacteraceae bacterium]